MVNMDAVYLYKEVLSNYMWAYVYQNYTQCNFYQ